MKVPKTIAVLDANVLYPAPIRDLLLRLAFEKTFTPKWTEKIQHEWTSHLLTNRPDIRPDSVEATVKAMNDTFRNAEISGYEETIDLLTLPDPNDRHVLAAGIYAEATHIVTFNLKDFPPQYVGSFSLQVIHPDQFIGCLMLQYPDPAITAFEKMVSALKKPSFTIEEILINLAECGLPETAKLISQQLPNC